MSAEQIISIIEKLIWPLLFAAFYLLNQENFRRIFSALTLRIEKGAEIQISGIRVGTAPVSLPSAGKDEDINENHLGLLHSSWRYAKKDKEFGMEMYVIQVIIQGKKDVLDRVEYVRYSLHPSYPNRIQTRSDREKNFELKELCWGEFNLKAEVKVRNQDELVPLSRYINLTESGENLLEH